MMRILHLPVNNLHDGITQYVLNNYRCIDRTQFVFDFVTKSPSLDFEPWVREQGGRVHYISGYSFEDAGTFSKEINSIFDIGYDAVHLHTGWWSGFMVEEIALQRKVPKIIVHAHNAMADISDPEARAQAVARHERVKQAFGPHLATHFCACSQTAANWIFGANIPRERIRIMHNGIDVEKFAYAPAVRARMRKELSLEQYFVLGHIGRFTYQKNHAFLLDVLEQLLSEHPDTKLMLIGGGQLRTEIEHSAQKRKLEDAILLLGYREDISALLQAMDVFLLPSRFEGLPITLVEAQAASLPCLASTNITPETALTQDIHFLPLDASQWAKECLAFVGHHRHDTRQQLRAAGFDIKTSVRELEKLYTE